MLGVRSYKIHKPAGTLKAMLGSEIGYFDVNTHKFYFRTGNSSPCVGGANSPPIFRYLRACNTDGMPNIGITYK